MDELNTHGARFKYWIEVIQRETIRSFSQLVGIADPSTIYSVVNGKTNISPKTLEKITSKFPDFPINWIRSGGETPGIDKINKDEELKRRDEEIRRKDEEIAQKDRLIKELIDIKVFLNNQYKEIIAENKEIIERLNKTIAEQKEKINELS